MTTKKCDPRAAMALARIAGRAALGATAALKYPESLPSTNK